VWEIPHYSFRVVKQWLKAGILDGQQAFNPEAGTPQGGVISPLLANIALDGMERYLKEQVTNKYTKTIARSLNVVRYADDFVVLHKDKAVVQQCQVWLKDWLALRGLTLSDEKTKLVHTSEGFDFLGFNVRQYLKPKTGYHARNNKGKLPYKTLIKPSKSAIERQKRKLGKIVDYKKGQSQDKLIEELNLKIAGWANHYQHVVSSKVFSDIDHWLWHKTYRWARRRHPNKGRKWVYKKYFRTIKKRTGQFASGAKILCRHAATKIKRYIRVQSGRSIYDGDEMYWALRLARGYGDISKSKAKLLREQNGKCNYCHQAFKNGDKMETHHLQAKRDGGTNSYANLALLHKHCHDKYHAEALNQRHVERRDNHNLAPSYQEMSDIQAEIMGIV